MIDRILTFLSGPQREKSTTESQLAELWGYGDFEAVADRVEFLADRAGIPVEEFLAEEIAFERQKELHDD